MAINKALILSFYDAANFIDMLRGTYQQAKTANAKISLYQAGTDPSFNAAINAIIPPVDRQRIATMKTHLETLLAAWEGTYDDIINPT